MQASQESLVNALESIHSLLEESETRLKAARESLADSNANNRKHFRPGEKPSAAATQDAPQTPASANAPAAEELSVPVLEDIVVPGSGTKSGPEPLPLFAEPPLRQENTHSANEPPPPAATVQERIESLRAEMEQRLKELLAQHRAEIEAELNAELERRLAQILAGEAATPEEGGGKA